MAPRTITTLMQRESSGRAPRFDEHKRHHPHRPWHGTGRHGLHRRPAQLRLWCYLFITLV